MTYQNFGSTQVPVYRLTITFCGQLLIFNGGNYDKNPTWGIKGILPKEEYIEPTGYLLDRFTGK